MLGGWDRGLQRIGGMWWRTCPPPAAGVLGIRGQRMTDVENKSRCTVRVVVKLRPDQYDELFRHVCEIRSTMSAFLRESAAKAMKVEHLDTQTGQTETPLLAQ
jgi:hypothetical protein